MTPGRVLVTGAAGLIGRGCVAQLAARGWQVHAVSRRPRADGDGVAWHAADLLEPGAAARVVDEARPTHLVHLAWETAHGAFWTSPDNLRWVAASLDLARAFAEAGGRRAVVAGTCAEYRWGDDAPLVEGSSPLEPATLYGASKHALHLVLQAYAAQAGVSLAWGRVFFLYGPGESPGRLVPSLALAMLDGRPAECSHGRQVRDFLHVDDAGRAFAALLAGDVEGPVNIASGRPASIAEVARLLGEATGRPDLLRLGARPAPAGEPAVIAADVARLRDEVGWRPRQGLDQGLRATVDALRAPVRA